MPICSGRHADAGVGDRHRDPTRVRISCCRASARTVTVPRSVNLLALLSRLSSALSNPRLVGLHGSNVRLAIVTTTVVVLGRERLDGLDDIVNQRCDRESLDVDFHLASFDLGQIENVVDQARADAGPRVHARG